MRDIKIIPEMPRELDIRPLTEGEIEHLAKLLGEKIERKDVAHWMSQSIIDVVRLSQPSARQRSKELRRIAREGRSWLRSVDRRIDLSSDTSLFQAKKTLNEVKPKLEQFCEIADLAARDLESTIKPGNQKTPPALDMFFDRMIGVAKRADVLPHIPGRAVRSQTAPQPPPAFFQFVKAALEVARDVITASEIPAPLRAVALTILKERSDDALVKILLRSRGFIGGYRKDPHGVTEWTPK